MDYALPSYNADTKLLALIGHPVSHSKSPAMHNAALQHQRLPYCYLAFDIQSKDDLPSVINGFRAMGVKGFNVTVPYKESIIPCLDEIDSEAKLIGAVNTVVNERGILKGYNTDAPGYALSLENELSLDFKCQKVLVIGAGGAARAIVFALARRGVQSITIANRTVSRAEELKRSFSNFAPIETVEWSEVRSLSKETFTLVINTTSAGLSSDDLPIEIPWLNHEVIVSDLIYNPAKTAFLMEAEKKGCTIHNGMGMFLYQGALAYELWTGMKPDISIMKKSIQG